MPKPHNYELPTEYMQADPANQEMQMTPAHPVEFRNVGHQDTFQAESDRRAQAHEDRRVANEAQQEARLPWNLDKPLDRKTGLKLGSLAAVTVAALIYASPSVVGGHEKSKHGREQIVRVNEVPSQGSSGK